MIDHVVARRLAATAIDVPLERTQASDLDLHLATCPACRNVSSALARDAAVLQHLDLGPVPISVRANVAIAAERGGGSPVGRWIGLVAVGALLILALGSGALGGVGVRGPANPDGADLAASPIHWQTGIVDVQASDFWIETAAGRITAAGTSPALKASGDAASRTLDVVWDGGAVGMVGLRLILVDIDDSWWVKGLQVSDGASGRWLDGQGALVGTSIGDGQLGGVDVDLVDTSRARVSVVGHLHFGDLVLKVNPLAAVDPNAPVPAPPVPVATGPAG